MKCLKNAIATVWRDERGGEVIEYALVLGLIVVAAIAIIGAVGTKVLAALVVGQQLYVRLLPDVA